VTALSLTIPLAEISDVVFNGKQFQIVYLLGSLLVFAGFVLVNLQLTRDEKETVDVETLEGDKDSEKSLQ
jgi:drug/metabolite transporter (DMT)-like permease